MADAAVESLLIRIGADVADLKKGMAEASKSLQGLDDATKDTAKGLQTNLAGGLNLVATRLVPFIAGVLAASKAVEAFQSALADVSAMGRLATATGTSVENLSALRFAAASVGVEFQVLQQAITGLTQRLAEGLSDPMSTVSLSLNAMGVSARDAGGQIRNFADLLPDLADRFAGYADGAAKAQLATALFGEEAGPRLLPLLNQGRRGITELMEEAKKLGLVTDGQVRQADEFQVATVRMNESVSALVREFAIRLAPAITTVADAITGLLRLLPRASAETSQFAAEQEQLRIQIQQAETQIAALKRAMETMTGAALQQARDRLALAEAELQKMRERQEALTVLQRMEASSYGQRGPGLPPPPDPAALREGAQEAIAEANFQLQQLTERLQGSRLLMDEMNFAWMSHAEIVAQASEHINQAYQRQGDQRRALASLETMLNKQQQRDMLSTATMAANVITQLFPKSKGAAIAAAVINTAVGITKALSELLPPWSWVQAGLIAASGAAQIATIRSTTPSGGGATPNPGGGGAGEQPGSEGAAPGRALHIQGIDPAAIFSGRQLEALIGNINDEVRNGATLITTRNIPT